MLLGRTSRRVLLRSNISAASRNMSLYACKINDIDDVPFDCGKLQGKVVVATNVASR